MRSRATILRATLSLIEERGFAAVNMSSVAVAANVSRQTVYSIFGSREALVSQAVATLAVDAWASVQCRLDATGNALAYVVEMIVAGRELTRREPVFRALVRAGDGNPIFDEDMISRARAVVADLMSPVRPLDPRLADETGYDTTVELVTRVALSVVLFDSDAVRSDDDLRRYLAHWLAPFLSSQ
ncbi:TetR/AcrR family transcriptional regulator [Amycolatopsis sp. K13G38]|uniref:TetR/AcrR family transcriptional regulator n=1 Tax=Amycolatopsis acididurans TaxID=2724524 RepID=A0ABX1IZL7_9PSEU|nr:TetR/AcrR family transcriptional regulator [Amycolatopsis acididurans]NKQ51550.1 TetR/AcrR family transcriptional regulator [Amycolatopsis acididurans]